MVRTGYAQSQQTSFNKRLATPEKPARHSDILETLRGDGGKYGRMTTTAAAGRETLPHSHGNSREQNEWTRKIDTALDGWREDEIIRRVQSKADLNPIPQGRVYGGGGTPLRDAQGNIITNLRGRQRVDVSTRYGHRFREYTEPKQMARVTAAAAPLTSTVYDDNAQTRTAETLAPSFTTRSRFPPLNRGDSNNATQEEHIMPAGAATTSRKSLHIEPADLDDPEITALLCKNLNLPKPDPLNPKSYKKRMEALLAKAGAMKHYNEEDPDPADYWHRFRNLGGCGAPRRDKFGHVVTVRNQAVDYDYASARTSPTRDIDDDDQPAPTRFTENTPRSTTKQLHNVWQEQIIEKRHREEQERLKQQILDEKIERHWKKSLEDSKYESMQREMRFRDAEDASYGGGDAPVVARRSREIAAVAGNDAAVYDAMTTAGNGNGAVPYTSSDASPRVSQESGATKLPAEAPVPRREHHVTNAARLVDKVFKKHSGVGASEARGAAAVDSAPQKALTASTPGLDGDARKEDASSGGSIDKKEDATIGSSIEKKEESRSSKKNLETKLPVASKKLAPVKTKPLAPNRVAQKQPNRQQPTSTISGRFNERLVTQKPSKKTTAPPSSIFANEPRRPMSKGRANILRQLESLGKDLERERIEQAIQITSLQRDAHRYQR